MAKNYRDIFRIESHKLAKSAVSALDISTGKGEQHVAEKRSANAGKRSKK